jgi:hypothetical protein
MAQQRLIREQDSLLKEARLLKTDQQSFQQVFQMLRQVQKSLQRAQVSFTQVFRSSVL